MPITVRLRSLKKGCADLGTGGVIQQVQDPRSGQAASRSRGPRSAARTFYVLRVNGRVWTPVVLPVAGAVDAKDLGVHYANGISLTRVKNNPSVGQYTFCNGVYSFNPYDTDGKVILISEWKV